MGSLIHQAIIVSVFEDEIEDVYNSIKEITEKNYPALLSFITPRFKCLNQYFTFAVLPSGSKYDRDGIEYRCREKIIEYLNLTEVDYACVKFGNDLQSPARIISSNTDYLNKN